VALQVEAALQVEVALQIRREPQATVVLEEKRHCRHKRDVNLAWAAAVLYRQRRCRKAPQADGR